MTSLFRESRLAVRRLGRAPSFTVIAVLTLALGIGANSAIFSIVNAVLLEPLPYHDPDRLVRVHAFTEDLGKVNVNPVDALDWRAEIASFESLGIFHGGEVTLTRDGAAERVPNARVTHGYFEMLGARPMLGRTFGAETETPGEDQEVILSYGLWRTMFAGDTAVLGRSMTISDLDFRIVGVMQDGYRDPLASHAGEPMLWRPMAIDRESQGRGGHFMQAFARLRPDVDRGVAQSELDAFTRRLEELYPDSNAGYSAVVEPLHESIVGNSRGVLTLLMVAVGIVLFIGCVNVANLLLARGATRMRELAIRSSLGASRLTLVRMLALEAVILATAGAAVGLLACRVLMSSLGAIVEANLLVRNPIELDGRVMAFAIAIAAAAAMVCAVFPAMQASGSRAFFGLRETGRSGGMGRPARLAMRGLVVTQIALSVVVLVAAGLLVRSLQRLTAVDPGVIAAGVVVMDVRLSGSTDEGAPAVEAYDALQQRLAGRPGVESVGITNIVPFASGYSCDGYLIDGDPPVPGGAGPCAETRVVSASYFDAAGIPIVSGRGLDVSDEHPESPGIVVSSAMASRFSGNPVGQRVRLQTDGEPWARVVGVVGDVRHFGPAREAPATIYMPFEVSPRSNMKLVVKGDAAERMIALVRSEVRAFDGTIPVNRIESLESLLADTVSEARLRTGLLSAFGALALILAASGIYGVFSFQVASGRRDTGVRMALGADGRRVLVGVLTDVGFLAALGVVIGVAASLGAGRMLEAFLHDVSTTDPSTIMVVAGLLFTIALGASWIPAARAARLDPIAALKEE